MSYYRHHLKTLQGRTIHSWRNWPRWDDIQEEVAAWADCEPDEVHILETEDGGEFITIDGIPVAYVETDAAAHRSNVVPFPMQAAE